jgi:hypothetical protein
VGGARLELASSTHTHTHTHTHTNTYIILKIVDKGYFHSMQINNFFFWVQTHVYILCETLIF